MAIYRKTTPSSYPNTPASNFTDSSKNWRQHKNFYIRTDDLQTASLTAVPGRYTDSTRTWRRIKAMYRWNGSVWQKIFAKFAGQPYPEIPPAIRYTSYTGTDVEPFAMMGPGPNSIAQGASGTTYLWGRDGQNWQNDTPLSSFLKTFVYNSTPIPDTAQQITNDEGNFDGDKLRNTQAVIEQYDGQYIWYKDRKTLTNGSSGTAYSQTVRIIKQQPVINSLAFKTNNSVPAGALKYVTYSVANDWYRSIDQGISLLKWYILDTQFETPTEAKLYGSTYISGTTTTETTTLLTGEDYFNIPETFNGASTTDKWLHIVLICKNSSSDTDLDYSLAPYNDVTTSISAKIGSSGATGPTSVTMTANANTITVNWSGASGATKYRIYWTTSGTASPDPSIAFDEEKGNVSSWAWGPGDPDKNTGVPSTGNDYYFYVSASGADNVWSPYVRSAVTQRLIAQVPTIIPYSYPVLTRTANTYNYSVTTGSWNNSPTGYDYQWKAQTSIPYPPYSSTADVGGNSSTYTSNASYTNWSIYCLVTARNSGGSSSPAQSNAITNNELVNPPVNQTAPTIQGSGRTFSVSSTGSWNPDDEDGVYLYQWKYNDQGSVWLNISNSYSTSGSTTASSISLNTSALDGLGIRCYVTATRSDFFATANSQSITITSPVSKPTIIPYAYPVLTRTAGTYNYSVTTGTWTNAPTGYSYQWKAQTSIPYPPYSSTADVGTNSSTYTSSASYTNWSIYCLVTASNSAGSAVSPASSNSIQNTAAGSAPSGGSVTLTPSGTREAGTTISANVTAMSGTAPITYTTTIRKATGTPPSSSGTATSSPGLTNPGSGTGNSVAQHLITDSEASGSPDQFKAFTVASNDFGTTVIESNVVTSTPRATTTTVNCLTCNSYYPNDGTYPYTTPDSNCTSGSRYYRTCVTPSGCENTKDLGNCVPAATTTTTAAPAVDCDSCPSFYPTDGSYTLVTDNAGCTSGSIYYRICITPGSCPNKTQYGNCVPAATTTTTTSRPLVYWKCSRDDVLNPNNPCGFEGQCLYDGNTYFPAGC